MNQEALENIAREEFRAHKGKLLRCSYLCGYTTENDSDDYACDVIVRVMDTPEDDLTHWNYEWLDPYWDVEVVRFLVPPAKLLRSVWIDGPSHNAQTGERTWSGVQPLSHWQYLKLILGGAR